eukprot:COSAG05_NODE_20595_length_278_cov_0.581006_1_plen_53_part_10
MNNAVSQYKYDKTVGSATAPPGFCVPRDDHWLTAAVSVLAGVGGNAVATLCAG